MSSTDKTTATPGITKSQFVDGTSIDASDFTSAFAEVDDVVDSASETVSVSAGDTHVKHLEDALSAGTGIAITKTNAGADEALSVAIDSHTHAASDITSGTLDVARIPALDESKVDSGAATSGQVLQADGAGGAAWVSPAGGGGELGASSELTIATGAITATGAHHTVDTEGDAASDDLETINGLDDGDMVLIVAEDAARTVVVKHGVGNIRLNGGVDFDLDNTEKGVLFIKSGSYVIGVGVPVTSGAGSGTVTSVGLSAPAIFSVTGSPVTSSGTLALGLASQTANQFLAAPDGSNGTPAFRAMVADDVPALPASKLTSGQVGISRGGTGAATSATARSSLGLAIGTDVQAHDALLDDIAAITPTKGDLLVTDGTDLLALGVGTNGQVLTADSAETSGVKWADAAGGGSGSAAVLRHTEAQNTSGGSYTNGAWRTRTLNDEIDPDGIVTLSTNEFTLAAGSYAIMAQCTAYNVGDIRIRIYDVTNSSAAGLGMTGTTEPRNTSHTAAAAVTIAGSTAYRIEMLADNTNNFGIGIATNMDTEVYTIVTIVKVA